MRFLLFLSITIFMVHGECPQMRDIPVMYNDDNFMCAKKWKDFGNDLSVNACNGKIKAWPRKTLNASLAAN